ncbi:MAG: outer membrane lipoprotein carrier protein LolA [Acidobacteria bacterium]|nr:MAG: outer membrane lipoprotein carrier protein LolA [Acidobacteriota bacterium]
MPQNPSRFSPRFLMTGLMACLLASLLIAAPEDKAPSIPMDPALEQVLERFASAQASIETLQADFEERKNLALLKDEVVLTGTLYHSRPLNFFWNYETPSRKQILLTSDLLVAYYPDLNKVEEVNVRRWNRRIRRYLQLGVNTEELRKDYDISLGTPGEGDPEGTDLLVLTPQKKRKRSRLQEIRIWLHPETGHTERITYLEKNGDVTTFSFSNIQVNAGIPETVYHIDLPEDVSMGDSFSGFAGGL